MPPVTAPPQTSPYQDIHNIIVPIVVKRLFWPGSRTSFAAREGIYILHILYLIIFIGYKIQLCLLN